MTIEVPPIGPAVITLGVFDGVHLGHRHAARATADAARARGARAVGLVFHPPPIEIIRPGVVVRRLLPLDMVLERLREAGLDDAVALHFNVAMREMSPEAFLDALAPGLELRGVAMTAESTFGRDRAGTLDRIAAIGAARGFEAIEIDAFEVDGRPVSSSRIRDALAAGDIELATRLLGAAPVLRGVVNDGGALELDYPAVVPGAGSYRGRAPELAGAGSVDLQISGDLPSRIDVRTPDLVGRRLTVSLEARESA